MAEQRSEADAILEAKGICLQFATRAGTACVLNDMGLVCRSGEVMGLVGESGSGKTVLAGVLLNHIRRPGKIVSGQVLFEGQDLLKLSASELQPIRGRQIAIIVSNARIALNPLIGVGGQIANIYSSHFDVSKKEAREVALEAIKATGINDPAARYNALPHELSGGMVKRIIIAAALVLEPKLLIADEPTSGLDVTIQAQVLDSMAELIGQKKTVSTVLMTRDLGIIAQYCTHVVVTYAGQVVEEAPVQRFFDGPAHPYSILLLASASLNPERGLAVAQIGAPPSKYNLPNGCLFYERCRIPGERCRFERPPLVEVEPGHLVRCWEKDGRL